MGPSTACGPISTTTPTPRVASVSTQLRNATGTRAGRFRIVFPSGAAASLV